MKTAYKDDLTQAWKVVYGEWVELSKIVLKIKTTSPNPEDLMIKHQSFKELSNEAKEAISIALKMTEETNKRPTKEQVYKAMKAVSFNSPFIAKKAIEEVYKWVKQL